MDEIKNIVEIIVAIVTVFSLIVIWLTLKEMKAQRHKSYEPYILPLNFEVLFLCKYPHTLLPIDTYSNIDDIKNEKDIKNLHIKFRNIGQGVAKDIVIKIDWRIEYQKYFETIKTEFEKLKIEIDLDISEISCWLKLNEEKRVLSGGGYPYQNSFYHDFDYLLPLSNNSEEIRIEMPSSVDLLFKLTILLLESLPDNKKEKAFNKLQKTFSPIISINYKDNLDMLFTSEYTLNIKTINSLMQGDILGKIYTLEIERLK